MPIRQIAVHGVGELLRDRQAKAQRAAGAVVAGDLFVAVPGESFDGREFAGDAVRRGAAAVVARGAAPPEFPVPWLRVEDPRALLGPLAAEVYGHPDRELVMAGVTGTNGKTTVVHLLAAMLSAAAKPAAVFGTLGYRFGEQFEPGERRLVPTALVLEIPRGFEGQVRPRSGLALAAGVTVANSPGTIDSDYRGEVGVILINLGREPFTVRRGDRIAQLVIARVEEVEWQEAESLSGSERGAGGFGSSGV